MAFINIASVPKYLDELKVLLSRKNLDLLALNETRLCEEFTDSEISIPGYNIRDFKIGRLRTTDYKWT